MTRPERFGSLETFFLVVVKLFDLGVCDVDLALDPVIEQILRDEVNFDAFFKLVFGESAGFQGLIKFFFRSVMRKNPSASTSPISPV